MHILSKINGKDLENIKINKKKKKKKKTTNSYTKFFFSFSVEEQWNINKSGPLNGAQRLYNA